jgi:hypothetical protein
VSGLPKTKALISASVTERRPVSGGREDLEDRLLSVVEGVEVEVVEGEDEAAEGDFEMGEAGAAAGKWKEEAGEEPQR